MASHPEPVAVALTPIRSRCRCGHLPTHHMVVLPVGGGGNFRLDASGPCEVCGDAVCRRFSPGGP